MNADMVQIGEKIGHNSKEINKCAVHSSSHSPAKPASTEFTVVGVLGYFYTPGQSAYSSLPRPLMHPGQRIRTQIIYTY